MTLHCELINLQDCYPVEILWLQHFKSNFLHFIGYFSVQHVSNVNAFHETDAISVFFPKHYVLHRAILGLRT